MARKARSSGKGASILVVDDQEEVLLSTRSLLEREGHRVLTAESGERALQLLKQQEVDLLLIDYFMPRMTGEQLVRAVRVFDPFVQIILQTGYSGEKPARSALAELDVQGYHDKADGPERLLLWIDAGLKAHRQLARAREQERRITDHGIGSPFHVLLVDGRLPALQALAPHIEREGYRVTTAHSSGEALDAFVRERPDFLVIDDGLLDQKGVDLIRRVRTLDPAVAVVAQCNGLDTRQRRQVRQSLALHGIHDKRDEPDRLLELLDSAANAMQRVERTRADQSLRGLVLAKLCHDLRSYIHVVHGYTELLCDESAAAERRPVLERLAAASDSALELVQAYLDLAHLESPGVGVRRELVSVDALSADLQAHAERQIGSRPLRFVVTVPSPGAVIHTDGEKLRAILTQLLSNAIKFSLVGTIELQIRFAEERTDFVLTDTGSGVSDMDLTSLFRPFQQQPNAEVASTPGQGVGLAIALRLSQLLAATLRADRGEHGGAVFTLSLPTVALANNAQHRVATTMH